MQDLIKTFFSRDMFGRGNAFRKECKVGPREATCVLATADNASYSYFVAPYLSSIGILPTFATFDEVSPDSVFDGVGTVVIVRFLPRRWVQSLQRFKRMGGRVMYFMDDDLMDPSALEGLPPKYARKIKDLALRQRRVIESISDEYLVSTAYLAEKYAAWRPTVLAPKPSMTQVVAAERIQLCYHGTASHGPELAWLLPVMKEVLGSIQMTQFEVFGDHGVNKMYRSLPRTAVVHPMTWPSYLAYTAGVRRDIALAPLLANGFNAGRGPTKFFDFARMGAVGIYSDCAPYKGFIRNGIDGVLLPNDPEIWARTIVELSVDSARRCAMAEAARARAMSLCWDKK